ncbi:cytochrome c [Myxococcota bacterium]|nr:cytochrome c [Myxococcota bacterium]
MSTRILLGAFVLTSFLTACDSKPADTAKQAQPAQAQQVAQPAQPAQGQPAGDANAAPNPEVGRVLFMRTCANCHGPDGTGSLMRAMLPKIGDLTSAEMHGRLKDEDIITLITNGRDKMPALATVLNPQQIKDVVAYVRTLKK